MSMLRRLTNNSAANGFGIATTTAVQLATVPALVAAWGAHGFGVWMMMATIPIYIALSDMGFTDAACSEMAMRTARGDREAARRVFQTTAVLLLIASIIIVAIAAILLSTLQSAASSPAWLREYGTIIFALVVYSVLALLSRIPLFALRGTGHYALGTFTYDSIVLLEGLAVVVVAILGAGYAGAVAALIAGRVVNLLALYPLMRRTVPWLKYGFRDATGSEARYLFPRALGALGISAAVAVQVQMSVLIVGAFLSPVAVAIYVPVRTASRIVTLVVNALGNATTPEISAAEATGDRARLAKLVIANLLLIGAILLPGELLFALFGRELVALWTGGRLSAGEGFIALMALAMVLHGSWNVISRMLLAVNKHSRLALALCIIALLSLPLIAVGARFADLEGAAAAACVAEALCLVAAILFARNRIVVSGHWRTGLQAITARALARFS